MCTKISQFQKGESPFKRTIVISWELGAKEYLKQALSTLDDTTGRTAILPFRHTTFHLNKRLNPVRIAEGLIFFSFLFFFEFILVLAGPYIDKWSGGVPGFKLLFNAAIAALLFPAHAFFESRLKKRLVRRDTKPRNEVHEHR